MGKTQVHSPCCLQPSHTSLQSKHVKTNYETLLLLHEYNQSNLALKTLVQLHVWWRGGSHCFWNGPCIKTLPWTKWRIASCSNMTINDSRLTKLDTEHMTAIPPKGQIIRCYGWKCISLMITLRKFSMVNIHGNVKFGLVRKDLLSCCLGLGKKYWFPDFNQFSFYETILNRLV